MARSAGLAMSWEDRDGLPIGVMFHAGWGREDRLLQVAAQLERARPSWFDQVPPVHVTRP